MSETASVPPTRKRAGDAGLVVLCADCFAAEFDVQAAPASKPTLLSKVTSAGLLPGRKSPRKKMSPPPLEPPVPVKAPAKTAVLLVEPTLMTCSVPFWATSS